MAKAALVISQSKYYIHRRTSHIKLGMSNRKEEHSGRTWEKHKVKQLGPLGLYDGKEGKKLFLFFSEYHMLHLLLSWPFFPPFEFHDGRL